MAKPDGSKKRSNKGNPGKDSGTSKEVSSPKYQKPKFADRPPKGPVPDFTPRSERFQQEAREQAVTNEKPRYKNFVAGHCGLYFVAGAFQEIVRKNDILKVHDLATDVSFPHHLIFTVKDPFGFEFHGSDFVKSKSAELVAIIQGFMTEEIDTARKAHGAKKAAEKDAAKKAAIQAAEEASKLAKLKAFSMEQEQKLLTRAAAANSDLNGLRDLAVGDYVVEDGLVVEVSESERGKAIKLVTTNGSVPYSSRNFLPGTFLKHDAVYHRNPVPQELLKWEMALHAKLRAAIANLPPKDVVTVAPIVSPVVIPILPQHVPDLKTAKALKSEVFTEKLEGFFFLPIGGGRAYFITKAGDQQEVILVKVSEKVTKDHVFAVAMASHQEIGIFAHECKVPGSNHGDVSEMKQAQRAVRQVLNATFPDIFKIQKSAKVPASDAPPIDLAVLGQRFKTVNAQGEQATMH